jgi:hypothetical protein
MAVAAAEVVPALLRLRSKAEKTRSLERNVHALELYERALAAAEASLPPDSLVLVFFLEATAEARVRAVDGVTTEMLAEEYNRLHLAAWRNNEQALAMTDRCMALLLGRWRAGSLFTHTPDEAAFLSSRRAQAPLVGAELLISCACNALMYGPPLRAPAADDAFVQGLHGSLLALLELNARGVMANYPPTTAEGQAKHILLQNVLNHPAYAAILARLRLVLSRQEEVELRQLAQRFNTWAAETAGAISAISASAQQRAAADVARHGLQRCALPSCAAQEAHPRLFKLCGRCYGVAYCGAAHCREDWKRHKRQDDCTAAASQTQ